MRYVDIVQYLESVRKDIISIHIVFDDFIARFRKRYRKDLVKKLLTTNTKLINDFNMSIIDIPDSDNENETNNNTNSEA